MPRFTRHAGVALVKRGKRGTYARWTDARTGKLVEQSLGGLGLKTRRAFEDWAARKARELDHVRQAVAAGELAPVGPAPLDAAVTDYLDRARARLRSVTVEDYRFSLAFFLSWAGEDGVHDLSDLTAPRLHRFRDWLRRQAKPGSEEVRTVTSFNHTLREVRAFLLEARRLGRVDVSREAIAEAFKKAREPAAPPAFLRPPEIRALLEACLRHDRDPGREMDAAPYVLFVLLSGVRSREARELRWDAVHLDGAAPEILLNPEDTKTHAGRSIDLSVSPSLVPLLSGLRFRSAGAPHVFGGAAPVEDRLTERLPERLPPLGAPPFSWQRLRQTCGTFLTNAPGIYGAASAWLSAKRLGHSVLIAEKRYAGVARDIPAAAKTLEAAMRIEDVAATIAGGDRTAAGRRRVSGE